MEELRLTYQDVLFYLTVFNVVMGFFFGAFPMIVGLKMQNRKYAVFGLAGAVIGGGLLGVLVSFAIAFVFTWLIIRGIPAEDPNENSEEPPPFAESENPTDL